MLCQDESVPELIQNWIVKTFFRLSRNSDLWSSLNLSEKFSVCCFCEWRKMEEKHDSHFGNIDNGIGGAELLHRGALHGGVATMAGRGSEPGTLAVRRRGGEHGPGDAGVVHFAAGIILVHLRKKIEPSILSRNVAKTLSSFLMKNFEVNKGTDWKIDR